MLWRKEAEESSGSIVEDSKRTGPEPIHIEHDAPRPATILRVAGELEARGAEILELFKELESPRGQAIFPVHLRRDGRELFVEVETGPWDETLTAGALDRIAVLRGSEYAGAGLEVLSAYPVPPEVRFLTERSPAALLQLDLIEGSLDDPEGFAEVFLRAASRQWGVDLDYSTESLPLTEDLLMAALDGESDRRAPVLDALVGGLGCFLGEIIRRSAPVAGSWTPEGDWGEGPIVELEEVALDPIGKAHAFLNGGRDDSISFYAEYVLKEIEAQP